MEIAPEERRAAHEVIYSIFELYELKVHGFLPSAIWKIREPDRNASCSASLSPGIGRLAKQVREASTFRDMGRASRAKQTESIVELTGFTRFQSK